MHVYVKLIPINLVYVFSKYYTFKVTVYDWLSIAPHVYRVYGIFFICIWIIPHGNFWLKSLEGEGTGMQSVIVCPYWIVIE
jgi:hypothetical protein